MTRKKILGSHVKRLLSGVSAHGRRHLTEVETDLVQTTLLLEEAVEKLTTSFMAIHQRGRRQPGKPSTACWPARRRRQRKARA
jgi:hypothetical protein